MGRIMDTLNHLRAYAYGESCKDLEVVGKHAFDLPDDDVEVLLKGLEALQLLTVFDCSDVTKALNNLSALHTIASEVDNK